MRFNTFEESDETVTPLVAVGRDASGYQQYEELAPIKVKLRPATRGGQVMVWADQHFTAARTYFTDARAKAGEQLFPRENFFDGFMLIVNRVYPRINLYGDIEKWAYLCELEADPEA